MTYRTYFIAYMNRILAVTLTTLALFQLSSTVLAQEEARAAWEITNFDINANIQQAERALSAVAILSATNVGRGTGSSFTFRINSKASIKAVTIGGANANFRTVPESYGNIQRVTVPLPSFFAPNASVVLNVSYSLPVESNAGLAAIAPLGSQFLPLSHWYPAPNTAFTARGADTAPFHLVVNGANVISSGVERTGSVGPAGSSVYEQTLNAQPFFVQGDWDKIEGSGESRTITAFIARGATPEEKKQADAIIAMAANARSYYTGLLGPAPDLPIRLVSTRRGAGFNDAGTMLIEPGAFRRTKMDSATTLLIAEAISRLWLGGQTAVRGEGGGLLREGLARFLATLFIEKQFGQAAAEEERLRERLAYSAVAKRDAPLARVTPLDATYFNSVPNKGAMVWRLIDRTVGHDAFISTLRGLLQSGKGSSGINLFAFRSALVERGGDRLKMLLDQQLDQITELDLMVGLPQQRGSELGSALRNLGSTDAVTTVKATTASGEQVAVDVVVPAHNFGEAVFKTPARITRVEIDPEKLYPQLDYSNDSSPPGRDLQEALSEAARQFGAQDYVKAESIARELLVIAPNLQEARIILARALLGQNRIDEAEKLFRSALDGPLPTPATLAWANIGLGEISLKKGLPAEAAKQFNDAVRADAEYASSLAARAARIRSETAANILQVGGAARTFVTKLDQAITSGKKVELESRIVSGG